MNSLERLIKQPPLPDFRHIFNKDSIIRDGLNTNYSILGYGVYEAKILWMKPLTSVDVSFLNNMNWALYGPNNLITDFRAANSSIVIFESKDACKEQNIFYDDIKDLSRDYINSYYNFLINNGCITVVSNTKGVVEGDIVKILYNPLERTTPATIQEIIQHQTINNLFGEAINLVQKFTSAVGNTPVVYEELIKNGNAQSLFSSEDGGKEVIKSTLSNPKKNLVGEVEYTNYIKRKGSRAWRNNNPGNLQLQKPPSQYGALQREDFKKAGQTNPNHFLQFPSELAGFKALLKHIDDRSSSTIKEYIYNFCPPISPGNSSDDTEKYINSVIAGTNLTRDTKLSALNTNQKIRLAISQAKKEGFFTKGEIVKK